MSIALSSIGVKTYYTVADKNDTPVDATEWIQIPEIKSIPSFNVAPNTIEVTSLEDEQYTRYVNGLRDLGGALEYTANITQELLDLWNGRAFVKATGTYDGTKTYYTREGNEYIKVSAPTADDFNNYYEHQKPSTDEKSVMYKYYHLEENDVLWIVHIHPSLNQATYLPFEPTKIAQPETSVNSAYEGSVSVTPIDEPRWDIKPDKSTLKTYPTYINE